MIQFTKAHILYRDFWQVFCSIFRIYSFFKVYLELSQVAEMWLRQKGGEISFWWPWVFRGNCETSCKDLHCFQNKTFSCLFFVFWEGKFPTVISGPENCPDRTSSVYLCSEMMLKCFKSFKYLFPSPCFFHRLVLLLPCKRQFNVPWCMWTGKLVLNLTPSELKLCL